MKVFLKYIGKIRENFRRYLYVLAVFTVLSLVGGTQVITQSHIGVQKEYAYLLEIAENQKEYTYKIVEALKFYTGSNDEKNKILDYISVYDKYHFILFNEENKSIGVDEVNERLINKLTPHYNRFTNYSKKLLLIDINDESRAKIFDNLVTTKRFLNDDYDLVISRYHHMLSDKINNLQIIELALAGLTILILLFEVIFIFKPTFEDLSFKNKRITYINKELKESIAEKDQLAEELKAGEEELLQYLEHLNAVNQKLTQSEQELKVKNEDLVSINNALDKFVYSVSHDLRSPIASSIGLISIMRKEENIEVLRQYFNLQEKSLTKLDNFISEILDYSRNARLELSKDEIDLDKMIVDVIDQYSYMDYSETIEKTINVNINQEFYSDSKRLHIVFSNLISNSIKYISHRREHPYIHIDITDYREGIKVIIDDNGQGIAEEHLPNIFQMFYRADNEKPGSGLGLHIVQEIVKKMGGDISVKSVQLKGTTFEVYLPNLKVASQKEMAA
ncbi:sensor histidine kinase [Chondrinema litorale]|uniref:sensor histidine kinase n=1 Tax=Chondrinema litorale TaxID=2994555 RepID=UPI002542D369|nr:HAMP domain-containing sensor histidine kinase [Chondrinema litorale]UZR93959.1 HAMP domain-containing sensor histidine kinase [Chondrinema litorale]